MRRLTSRFIVLAIGGLALFDTGSTAAQVPIVSGLTLPPGASVTIEVDVVVADPLSDQVSVHRVCAQTQVLADGIATVSSDDPATPTIGDGTCTSMPEYGDAPNDGSTTFFPTAAADDGAVHALGSGVYLGASADADADGQATAGADGDDTDGNNDDDGIVFTSAIDPGYPATVDVEVSSACGALSCYLNAWMDFNGDGDWDDADEKIFSDHEVTAGVNSGLSFPVPVSTAAHSELTCRFRISTNPGLTYTGLAVDGEVEDYRVVTVPVELLTFGIE